MQSAFQMADSNSLNDNFAGSNSTIINPSQLSGNSIESLLFHATVNELEPLFDKINLPHSTQEKSKQIFQSVFSHGIFSSDPKIPNPEIFASILYIAVIEKSAIMSESDSNGHPSSCTTLTAILKATNVNINKMFPALQVIMEKVQVSDVFAQHFHNLKQRYCVISLLFHKFERKCGDVFKKETSENDENESVTSPIRKTEGVECRTKLCWVLFLLTKYHLLSNSSELYLHIQFLLCCLEYVLSKTPMFLLNSPYASIRFRHASPCAVESMLEKLAKDFDVNFEETQALYVNSIEPFFNDLSDSDDDVDLFSLCEMYREISSKTGALNELLFLSHDALITTHQVARVSVPSAGHTSLKPGQMTPIRGTLNAVHQLEKLLSGLKEEPGERLTTFVEKCYPDPTDVIRDLVTEMKDKFLTAYKSQCEPGSSQNALGQQRLSQGTKLFYKVLECVIIKNSNRPTENVIASLLKKDIFVMSAFAFSMEIILATYGQRYDPKTKTLTFGDSLFPFPWILKVMSLHAYKFDIMLENFISAVESLSPDIVRYLQSICNQILEKLVWEEGSPIFDALSQSDMSPLKGPNGQCSTALNSVELLLSPAPSSMPTYRSPAPSSVPTDRSSSSSSFSLQDQGVLPPTPCIRKSQSLTAVLTKVSKLGFSRVSSLCNSLDLSERIKDMIWTCFDYCLKENFILLKNRHIDQVIICCVLGICKALNLNISLEAVVDQYKMLPFAKSEVYEKVFISDGGKSSIGDFYRTVFMESKTSEKTLQFAQACAEIPPLSPRPKIVWNSPRPCSHLGNPNLTVSPMPNHSIRSPGKYCSSIGSAINPQSPNTFKMINEKMSVKSQRVQRTVKRLNFDDSSQQSSDFKQRKLDSCKLRMA